MYQVQRSFLNSSQCCEIVLCNAWITWDVSCCFEKWVVVVEEARWRGRLVSVRREGKSDGGK